MTAGVWLLQLWPAFSSLADLLNPCLASSARAQAQLLYLDAADQKRDITMYVNSPGGSVTAGMAVFDTMRHVRPDCSTVCVGLAASMGAFLLASGQKVFKFTFRLTLLVVCAATL